MVLYCPPPPPPPLPPSTTWVVPPPPLKEALPTQPLALSQCHVRLATYTTAHLPHASPARLDLTSLNGDRQRAGRAPQTPQLTLLEVLDWSSASDKIVHSTQRRVLGSWRRQTTRSPFLRQPLVGGGSLLDTLAGFFFFSPVSPCLLTVLHHSLSPGERWGVKAQQFSPPVSLLRGQQYSLDRRQVCLSSFGPVEAPWTPASSSLHSP